MDEAPALATTLRALRGKGIGAGSHIFVAYLGDDMNVRWTAVQRLGFVERLHVHATRARATLTPRTIHARVRAPALTRRGLPRGCISQSLGAALDGLYAEFPLLRFLNATSPYPLSDVWRLGDHPLLTLIQARLGCTLQLAGAGAHLASCRTSHG